MPLLDSNIVIGCHLFSSMSLCFGFVVAEFTIIANASIVFLSLSVYPLCSQQHILAPESSTGHVDKGKRLTISEQSIV